MTLHVTHTGSPNAPTIVFLHGLGVSSWMWTEQVRDLSADFHCLTIDLPNAGGSIQMPWISFADSARQVAAIIAEQVPGGKAHLVGLSLGGYVGLQVLRDAPQVVESLMISGVAGQPIGASFFNRAVMRLLLPLNKVDPFIWLMGKVMNLPAEAIPYFQRDSKQMNLDGVRRMYDEVLNYDLASAFDRCDARVLALAGDKEVGAIVQGLPHFAAVMPNAVMAYAPNAHHAWNGEHPQLFADTIRAWVTGQPLPAALKPVQAAPAMAMKPA